MTTKKSKKPVSKSKKSATAKATKTTKIKKVTKKRKVTKETLPKASEPSTITVEELKAMIDKSVDKKIDGLNFEVEEEIDDEATNELIKENEILKESVKKLKTFLRVVAYGLTGLILIASLLGGYKIMGHNDKFVELDKTISENNDRINKDIISIDNKANELDTRVLANVDSISQTTSSLGELDSSLGDLSSENEELKAENDNIKSNLASISSEIDNINTEIVETIQGEADIHPDIVKAIVLVASFDDRGELAGTGSGTVISPKGYILTNNHVISDSFDRTYGNISICIPNGDGEDIDCNNTARLVNRDISLDLALLKFDKWYEDENDNVAKDFPDDHKFIYREIEDNRAKELKLNDTLFALGYPGSGGYNITFTKGVYSGSIDDMFYKTDVNISPGNSGGFVFTPTSAFAGVPTLYDPDSNIGYIVKPDVVMEFIGQSNVNLYN